MTEMALPLLLLLDVGDPSGSAAVGSLLNQQPEELRACARVGVALKRLWNTVIRTLHGAGALKDPRTSPIEADFSAHKTGAQVVRRRRRVDVIAAVAVGGA